MIARVPGSSASATRHSWSTVIIAVTLTTMPLPDNRLISGPVNSV
jgi:hypothetical protein